MSVLVGIIDVNIKFMDKYGLCENDVSKLVLIKEGSHEELLEVAQKYRQDSVDAEIELKELPKKFKPHQDRSFEEECQYEEALINIKKKRFINQFSKLMILEGMVV